MTVTNARMAVDWNLMPAAGRGELAIREFSGQTAGGRVAGKANYLMATDGTRLDGRAQFTNVEVGAVARATDTLATVGIGRATGVVAFAGRNVRSVKDLTGSVRATLGPAQALQLPVLKDSSRSSAPAGRRPPRSSRARSGPGSRAAGWSGWSGWRWPAPSCRCSPTGR